MIGGSSKFLMLLTTSFPLLCPRPSVFRLARHSRVSLACLPSAAHARFSSKSRLGFPIKASEQIHTQTSNVKGDYTGDSLGFLPNNEVLHPWPEWSKLVENIGTGGYFDRQSPSGAALEGRRSGVEDSFSVIEDLPEEFVRAVSACLSFARDRPDLLGSLSRKDIEVVVENGSPFLFKDALDSARRMRSFLGCSGNSVLEIERAHTVDLMRFLLSYACNPLLASDNNVNNRELVELSVRNLLSELADASRTIQGLDRTGSVPNQFSDRYGQTPKPIAQNIEMKRGDWICVKCSFMNFARNLKCLECNEARPKRQLTGGEWECPQCDFFNYGRNLVCLRCDCKRPGEASYGTTTPRFGLDYSNGSNLNKADIESRLAANDEKAVRWFNKVSHLNNASDLGSAIADEDFPEIMPLRKGVNKFVVSTRKTPLERRLANAQYRKDLGNDGTPEGNDFQAGDGGGISPNKTPTSISRSLDRIIGNSYTLSETDNSTAAVENTGTEGTFVSSSASPQYRHSDGNNSGYVPFVPLPADMFGKPQKSNTENEQVTGNYGSVAANSSEPAGSISVGMGSHRSGDGLLLSEKPVNQAEGKDNSEQAEKSERWFKKVAELHDVTDPASAISDEDFPEIMPMRKGENRFVVSKKKDRSLTSPLYKRRMAMEQASNTNFVPFVPFPPDYFAKKDKQPETGASAEKSESETSDVAETSGNLPNQSEKSSEGNAVVPDWGASGSSVQRPENQQTSRVSWNASFSGKSYNESKTGAVGGAPTTGNPTQRSDNLPQLENQQTSRGGWNTGFGGKSFNESKTGAVYGAPSTGNSIQRDNLQSSSKESWNSGSSWKESREDSMHLTSQQPANPQNTRESWNRGFSGKSLEGSAVKEPDPLDMSQEAKEQRWFRRVAQIKDISELSNIPDEDFPDIMPMRKGVNRFVVSKRKTPLERRLTSPQYRRNLPIVSSDPVKKENDPS